ncbi:DNA mismatch repair protein MutL [Vararia minispora EC-137]|uniref:DNA mismatch repair protein MutL n=1 Tax=Vararia minispora EC-137 TaxID=1314806 RepID=A0ACB8QL94_9AGAM|nr:DNA mismatch repair protein MutL [Vararia minispora EC-137]
MTERDASPELDPSDPKPIRKLKESLINRIAAGEIIQRPANALKELIENSLDAGATAIKTTVKDGGMKLLQIQDNGCGIKKADLPILAQRFTTSKISAYSDLSSLRTYGFRGEALASISHVANLTVTTKTRNDSCAWKASYVDGELVAPKAGANADPKPFAGVDGTTITVENLFYNTPIRLSALRGSSEEYARILDVIQKYSIHNALVSFVCKKVGSSTPDISTPADSSTLQAIRSLYGQSIGKSLLHIDVENEPNAEHSWKAEVYFSNANYHAKRTTFLLFINHRLVESNRIKRALEAVYTGVLPKGASPFFYVSLELDPRSVDVNVHPTKREVHFIDEDDITIRIADNMQTKLAKAGERTFEYQSLLTGGVAPPGSIKKAGSKDKARAAPVDDEEEAASSSEAVLPVPGERKIYSQHKVRTSAADRTLDAMFPVPGPSQVKDAEPASTPKARETFIQESTCYLLSIRGMRRRVLQQRHRQLYEIIQNHTFVGIVDLDRELSLIQHTTRLYLVSHGALSEELFYQLGLRQFGNLPRLRLDPPPPLRELIALAIEAEEHSDKSGMSKNELVEAIAGILLDKREMLRDYFSLTLSEDGLVESLPLLHRESPPNLDKLPLFLMRLGPQVNWTSEDECLDSFLRELAYFYTPGPSPFTGEGKETDTKAERWQIEHVLFPAMRQYLVPPKNLLDRDIVMVANVPDLYRVFERC